MVVVAASDSSNKNEYLERLQVLQKIRKEAGGELNLPQICVVGDQSSGKSSALGELTGIKFPVHSGICTKVPIVVECTQSAEVSYSVFSSTKENMNCVSI